MFSGWHWSGEIAVEPTPNIGLGAFDGAPFGLVPLPNQAGGAALRTDYLDCTVERWMIHARKIQRTLIAVNMFVVRPDETIVVGFMP